MDDLFCCVECGAGLVDDELEVLGLDHPACPFCFNTIIPTQGRMKYFIIRNEEIIWIDTIQNLKVWWGSQGDTSSLRAYEPLPPKRYFHWNPEKRRYDADVAAVNTLQPLDVDELLRRHDEATKQAASMTKDFMKNLIKKVSG